MLTRPRPNRRTAAGTAAAAVAVALFVIVTLASCHSPAAAEYGVFERQQSLSDRLPDDVPMDAFGTLLPDTTRFVGEDDGERLYLAKDADDAVCLAIVGGDDDWWSGCTRGAAGVFSVEHPPRSYAVRPDGVPGPEGSRQISANVYVVDE